LLHSGENNVKGVIDKNTSILTEQFYIPVILASLKGYKDNNRYEGEEVPYEQHIPQINEQVTIGIPDPQGGDLL
jgi:hypothetical protein